MFYLLVSLVVAAVTLSAMHSSFTSFPLRVPMQDNIGRAQGHVFLEAAIVRKSRDTRLASVAGSEYR